MSADYEEVRSLIENQNATLERWYRGYLAPADRDTHLTSGSRLPDFDRIGMIFQNWMRSRRDDLRKLICQDLKYAELRSKVESGKYGIVGFVTAIIAQHYGGEVDALATAVLIVTREGLDSLCAD